jgi:protein phosphatase
MLYCPNPACQAPNDETQKYCQKCGVFVPKRYLWAVGRDAEMYKPGELLLGRYLCKGLRLFLDTQPGQMPEPFQEIPAAFTPYLRLSPFRLHVPQVYDVIGENADPFRQILMLNEAAIADPTVHGAEAEIHLLPSLEDAWPTATPMRQLHWLWQIAQLWQPLHTQSVATSLLTSNLIRTEGPILRLLELQTDKSAPGLGDLAHLWQGWLPQAKPEIAAFLERLCEQMIEGQIWSAEQLLACLDQALNVLGKSQTRHIELATQTDQGPSRQRNEDACYPPSGSHHTRTANDTISRDPVVIVCDGIGGHQGGDVASGLAIASLQKHVEHLQLTSRSPEEAIHALEEAVRHANALISQRNDVEHRLERQRMGTTLVMALVHDHQLYVTHVGDSRAYWITRYGCHQITLDDDIASREVRLGYGSYRQALQQPIAGSLVQALGMGPSSALHPTVQRFMLDEDSVFLLCSDGLSDFDRVDESWDTAILPIVHGKQSVAAGVPKLVTLANTRNGHDNVTVALLYCRVGAAPAVTVPVDCATPPEIARDAATSPISDSGSASTSVPTAPADPESATSPEGTAFPRTQVVAPSPEEARPSIVPLVVGILSLLAISVGLIYFLLPGRLQLWSRQSPPAETPENPTPLPEDAPPGPPLTAVAPDLFLETTNPIALFEADEAEAEQVGVVPVGSVLQVAQRRALPEQPVWVEMVVCSVPQEPEELRTPPATDSTPALPLTIPDRIPNIPFPDLNPGRTPSSTATGGDPLATPLPIELNVLEPEAQGWARENTVLAAVIALPSPNFIQRGICAATPEPGAAALENSPPLNPASEAEAPPTLPDSASPPN